MVAAVLACDWGTTNLRAWTLDAAGGVVADRDFPGLGVSRQQQPAKTRAGQVPHQKMNISLLVFQMAVNHDLN